MHNYRDRRHNPGENLRRCGQPEAENLELPGSPSGCEPKKLATLWMHRNLKVGILQIDGHHPVVPPQRAEDRLSGFHPELRDYHRKVQGGEVNDWPPPSRFLRHHEHVAVIPWRRRRRLHRTLAAKSPNFLLQSSPPDGLGRVGIQNDGCV